MRTKPHIKIIIHWILIVVINTILLTYLYVNLTGFLILAGIFLLSLIFNRTTIFIVKDEKLTIRKNNLLVLPFFERSFRLEEIDKFQVMDLGLTLPGGDTGFDFDAMLILELFTGSYFYKPRYKIRVCLKQKEDFETEVNISKNEIEKIKKIILNKK